LSLCKFGLAMLCKANKKRHPSWSAFLKGYLND
jgi:hypothetical protein